MARCSSAASGWRAAASEEIIIKTDARSISSYLFHVEMPLISSEFFPPQDRVARVRAAVRPVSAEVLAALTGPTDKLKHGAAAVATGQQIGVYLGPLYSLYKAATAVAAARRLEEEAGVPCVPLFWLQTEDHDFAEIASCTILPSRVLQLPPDDARVSVGCRRLGPEAADLARALGKCLAGLPHAEEVQTLFAEAYAPGTLLADAFVKAMSRFYPELVFVEPRRLPSRAVFAQAMARAAEIERVLVERGRALRAAGFEEQVKIRPGYTLLFHHPEGPEGPRFRLRQGEPAEHLSTSALLRPILQDALLPTAAYVGGPGEVAYLAQATALYPIFELTPPLIIPRARFRLIPPAVKRVLDQLKLVPADAEDPGLFARLAPTPPPGPDLSWAAELDVRLDGYPGLPRDVARARRSIHHALARLERRHRHAALQRETTLADRVLRLQEWLFPGGVPQERVHGVPFYAALAGITEIGALRLDVDLFNPSVKDIWL
jgi:uncharacterized protein YllA (UPF0747 family)